MKKFRYTLESVLQVKYRLEELALAALAERQGQLIAAQNVLNNILEEKSGHLQAILTAQRGPLNLDELLLNQRYLEALNQQISQQKEKIKVLTEALEAQRQVVIQAQQERKTLEILKEKQLHSYYKAVYREEQIVLDEVAGNRHRRLGRGTQ